jgi:WD40 repeat protein/serine/threonine protein kinase
VAEREDLSGRTLGEFVLRERIDEGGFGAVYRCEQPLLGREAVVKVLHQRLRRNDVVLQRFMREAQLASRLDHPYAAHVYAFGIEHDDGLFWIAMEMVQGTALNRWLRQRGPLSLDQFVPFFECVAEVVQTAHDRGIVHRDLKPSNVMVIERAGRLLPKLLDFGIAKLLDEAALPPPPRRLASGTSEPPLSAERFVDAAEAATLTASMPPPQRRDLDHRLTHADSTIGSPPYMSPEQWTNAVSVGPAADLYALGVVAYEALTGRRPFIATTVPEYADLHCHAPVPSLGDGMPVALDRLFERALAKRPEQRWASALELAAALRVASGVGSIAARLPELDDDVRDAWLADAPQPLAESVAALVVARNAWQARDAAHDLVRGALRYLFALALATRAQVRDDHDDPALLELVRAMRSRDLAPSERVRVIRLLVRPLADRRGAHPIPELVDLVALGVDGGDGLDPIAAMLPATDQSGTEDAVQSRLARLVPELVRMLRRIAFVLDYVLVVPRGDGVERWTGARRQRRTLVTVTGGERIEHHPMLLDRMGRVCVDLWPLVQSVSPTEHAAPELFVFDGRSRHGARMVAAPTGYEHHDPAVWNWVAASVIAERAPEAGEDRAPYLGLAPFASSDAACFVGRETEVTGVIERLRHRPLQVVVGPSGSGKTSFVLAGVVPGLPEGWRSVALRPGASPLAALAARLADAGLGDVGALLATAPATAAALVVQAAGDSTVVVVIDQLEELFTLCASAAERQQFAAAIAQLAASAHLPVRVLAAIRDDFLMQLDALPPLRALLSHALVALGNPPRDDLVRIVVEPARRAGYELSDPELAHDMVNAVASRPGALALLSFTALRLWQLRDRTFHQLTRSAYVAMGGVSGALVRHAEATFDALGSDEQRLAREVFRQLVTADGARTQLSSQELRQRLATPRAGAVIDKLVAARLLALSETEGEPAGESQVEVIHDALLDAWPRLQRWVREDVDGARMRDQLRIAARQWNDRVRPRGLLWRDDVLADLERWLRRARPALSDLEAAFAEASRRHAGRAARLRRALALIAIGILIAVGTARCNSILRRLAAEERLRQVYADRGMDALLEGKNTEALVFLAEAARRGDDSPKLKFMVARAWQPRSAELGKATIAGEMWSAAYSPDGRRIVSGDDHGARIWDAGSLQPIATLPHGSRVYQVAFAHDGDWVVTAGADGFVNRWDARTGRRLAAMSGAASHPEDTLYASFAIAPGGDEIAAITGSGVFVDVWKLATGELIARLSNERTKMNLPSLAFSSDGRWLAISAGDAVRVFETATWKPMIDFAGPGVSALAFDPTGPRLATSSWRGDVSIWAVPDGRRLQHLHEISGKLDHVAVSPDGNFVAAAGQDGAVRIWNAHSGELQVDLQNHHGSVRWLEFDPLSRLVLSAGSDGVVALSDVARQMMLASFEGPRLAVKAARFDATSQHVIGASWDGTLRVWTIASRYLQWDTPAIGEDCGRTVSAEDDRRFLAVNCPGRGAQVWDTARGRLLTELPSAVAVPGLLLPAAITVSSAGDRAAVAVGNEAVIYALPGGHHLRTVRHADAVTALAFAQAGHDLVSGSRDGSLQITRDGAEPFELAKFATEVRVAGFVADGRVVVADGGGQIHVYDVEHRVARGAFEIREPVSAFRISLDGRRLVTIPPNGAGSPPVLCDLERLRRIALLDGFQGQVFSARFVQADRAVLTAGNDGVARLWDADTGRLRQAFFGGSQYLVDAAMVPDGTLVVTGGGDGVLRFWDVASSRMIWRLQAHRSQIVGLRFEDDDIVTHGFTGELARWSLSKFPKSSNFAATVDRIARCLPLRLDDDSGQLLEQNTSSCDR